MEYTPLDKDQNEIRLLQLLPKTRGNLTPRCIPFHASLNDRPRYFTLSYVWGDRNDVLPVLVKGKEVQVTRNLHDALCALQEDAPLIVWADALCINQSDDNEKSWQVSLMGDIYRHCESVYIWLGHADETSDSTIDYVNSFGAEAEACGIHADPAGARSVWRQLADFEPSVRILHPRPISAYGETGDKITINEGALNKLFYCISGWHEKDRLLPIAGLLDLFKRPWWSRVWVLQEITLPNKSQFLCGRRRVSRARLRATLNAILAVQTILQDKTIQVDRTLRVPVESTSYQRELCSLLLQRPTMMLGTWAQRRFRPFVMAALLRASCSGSISMDLGSHLESTDRRDKIFALLSISGDEEDLRERGIRPDYSLTYEQVYTNVTAAMLQQGHVALLSFCQREQKSSELPSWVPDWSRPMGNSFQCTENDYITLKPQYAASGSKSSPPPIHLIADAGAGAKLSISAILYDTVLELGPKISLNDAFIYQNPVIQVKNVARSLYNMTYRVKGAYINSKARIAAAARTLTAETGIGQDAKWDRIGDRHFEPAKALLTERGSSLSTLLEPKDGPILTFCSQVLGKSNNQLTFLSRKGHLGTIIGTTKPGDTIAILQGSQMPFILRRKPRSVNEYHLIGVAYVDGIMDGEAVKERSFKGIILV